MIQSFNMRGLRIQSRRFGAVEPRATSRSGEGRRVSAEVLAQTKERRPNCLCEDPVFMAERNFPPLRAGMPVLQLVELEEGCTRGTPTPGICSRLDNVRRNYGK